MRNKRIRRLVAASLLGLGCVSANASTTQPAADAPRAIEGYGNTPAMQDGAFKPANKDFKVVFTVTQPAEAEDKVNPGLDRVASMVNEYVAAGVPVKKLQFVAIVSGPATVSVMDNAHYQQKYNVDNPNLPLIVQLKRAGVMVEVLGQALSEHNVLLEWLSSHVVLAFSALTTVKTLQLRGYKLVRL